LDDDNPLARFEEDFYDFKQAWSIFTERYQTVKIRTNKLKLFIMKLPQRIRHNMGIQD